MSRANRHSAWNYLPSRRPQSNLSCTDQLSLCECVCLLSQSLYTRLQSLSQRDNVVLQDSITQIEVKCQGNHWSWNLVSTGR